MFFDMECSRIEQLTFPDSVIARRGFPESFPLKTSLALFLMTSLSRASFRKVHDVYFTGGGFAATASFLLEFVSYEKTIGTRSPFFSCISLYIEFPPSKLSVG